MRLPCLHFTFYVPPSTCYAIFYLSFLLGIAASTYGDPPQQLADYPNQLTQDGDLVILPNHGMVYIATDFHAHWGDFHQWLRQTQLVERIQAEEDVYGLILGDAIDHKPGDQIYEAYGDAKIVNWIMQFQQQLGPNGERLIYIKGNHEFAAADTYAMLKKRGMNPNNRQRVIDELYRSSQGAYFRQWNFVERMTDEHYDYLINLPVAAVGKNGVVAVHAGTSRTTKSLAGLVHPSSKVLEEMLWARPATTQAGGYTLPQTDAFLDRIGGRLLIVGHTPLAYFPQKNVKSGVARLGQRQAVFATGYGAKPGQQVYLVIDLAKQYDSAFDLEYGVEIRPLYPAKGK